MSKQILFSGDAKGKLQKGVNVLANAVKVTLGAKGRNVAIGEGWGEPHVTKDGVTVARAVSLEDPVENMGVEMARQAASRTVNAAGDGTTTATVLTQSLVNSGLELLMENPSINPMDLKRGIDKAVEYCVNKLDEMSVDVSESFEKVEQTAIISANNDEFIGKLIADAMRRVTVNGVITVEKSKNTETYVDVTEGLKFFKGLMSPYFITNPIKMVAEFENPNILLFGDKIVNTADVLPIIEMGLKTRRPLILVANDFDGDVIATLAQNKLKGGFKIAAVRAPSFNEQRELMMDDLAILLDGMVVGRQGGVRPEDFKEFMFGSADKVVMSQDDTVITGGHGSKENVQARVNQIKSQIEHATEAIDIDHLEQRLAKLAGGVGVIYVGANSESELKEKIDRVDDALAATKAAIEEGVVAGGGVTMLELSKGIFDYINVDNQDQSLGVAMFQDALTAPLHQILFNAGFVDSKNDEIINDIYTSGYPKGFDVKENKMTNMIESGIIDPKKVTRVAIEAAASAASMILITEATITDIPNEK